MTAPIKVRSAAMLGRFYNLESKNPSRPTHLLRPRASQNSPLYKALYEARYEQFAMPVELAKILNGLGAPLPPECLAACQKENTKPAASIFRLPRLTPAPCRVRYHPSRRLPKETF